ncbi:hypothetical protein ACQCSU_21205 [Pseudarthrobacter sp. O4]
MDGFGPMQLKSSVAKKV